MDGISSLFCCCLPRTNAKNIYKKRSEITNFNETHNKTSSLENLKRYIYSPTQNPDSIESRRHKFVLEQVLKITIACIDNKGSLPENFYTSKEYKLVPKNIKDEIEYLCCNESAYFQRDITRSAANLLYEICSRLYYIEHSDFISAHQNLKDFNKINSSNNFKYKIETITKVVKEVCPNNDAIFSKINSIKKNYLNIHIKSNDSKKTDDNNLNNSHAGAILTNSTTYNLRVNSPLLNEAQLEELCNFPVELIFNKIKLLFPDFNVLIDKQPKYTFTTEKHRTNPGNNHTLVNPHDLKSRFEKVTLVLYEPPAILGVNENNFLKIFYKYEKGQSSSQIKTLLILNSKMINPLDKTLSNHGKKIIEDYYCDTIYNLSHVYNPTDEAKSEQVFLVYQNGKPQIKYPTMDNNQSRGRYAPPTFNYEDVLITTEEIPDIYDKEAMQKFLDAQEEQFKFFNIKAKKEQLDEVWNKLSLPSCDTSDNNINSVVDKRVIQIILNLAKKWGKDNNGKIDIIFDYDEGMPRDDQMDIINNLDEITRKKLLVHQFLRAHKDLIRLPQLLAEDFNF